MSIGLITLGGFAFIIAVLALLLLAVQHFKNNHANSALSLNEEKNSPSDFYTPVMPPILPILYLTLLAASLLLLWSIAFSAALKDSNNMELIYNLFLVALLLFGPAFLGLFYAYKKGIFNEHS